MSLEDMSEADLINLKREWWQTAINQRKIVSIDRVCRRCGTYSAASGVYEYHLDENTVLQCIPQANVLTVVFNDKIVCDKRDKLFVPGKWFDKVANIFDELDSVDIKKDNAAMKMINKHEEKRRKELADKLTLNLPFKDEKQRTKIRTD